ncbi:carbohydrate ABC transporter permease [Streptomyces sp. NPDC020917]|uniref:carbohydrate ABC transporter permease n=1 Tax=Streptomyces sp. NPDC020917 TaxID=3365102 RepID=UPI003787DC99
MRLLSALVVGAAFFLPLYLILVNVFKHGPDIVPHPASLPVPPTLDNVSAVLRRPDHLFWYGLANSVEVVVVAVAATTGISAMLGYYLSRAGGLASHVILVILLSGLMVPPAVIIIPLTVLLRHLGLMTSLPGLILADVGYYVPFGVFVFMGFVRSVPLELEEAARIDGASRLRIFWQVIFPLLRPASASVMIFLGTWIWNDFLNPLIILGPATGTTVTVGIYRAIGEHQSDYGAVFAFMFLASLPILICYLVFQRYFVKGLTGGAVEG